MPGSPTLVNIRINDLAIFSLIKRITKDEKGSYTRWCLLASKVPRRISNGHNLSQQCSNLKSNYK